MLWGLGAVLSAENSASPLVCQTTKRVGSPLHVSIICLLKRGEPSADLGISADHSDAPSQGSAVN